MGVWVGVSIWGYVIIGSLIGRVAFNRTLGDWNRYKNGYWSTSMDRAFWVALWLVPFWPVMAPVVLMFRATPSEKLSQRQAELARQQDEIERLASRYGLKLPDEKAR